MSHRAAGTRAPASLGPMNHLRAFGLCVVLAVAGVGQAQLLAEVMTVTAIASQLFPSMSFPPSSLRAVGDGTGPLIARVPDAAAWTDWEVYTASGFAAALEPAFVRDIELNLLMDGYFRSETIVTEIGPERHTRVVFADGDRLALLYLIRSGPELVWLVARGR
jgi:hypothetical protein